jgi:hypothetical protein
MQHTLKAGRVAAGLALARQAQQVAPAQAAAPGCRASWPTAARPGWLPLPPACASSGPPAGPQAAVAGPAGASHNRQPCSGAASEQAATAQNLNSSTQCILQWRAQAAGSARRAGLQKSGVVHADKTHKPRMGAATPLSTGCGCGMGWGRMTVAAGRPSRRQKEF